MKKTLVLLLLMTGLSCSLKAQITDVYAGNDTIELRVGNYQYGFIQWQTAHDTVNWRDIEGANENSYRFFPTENAYYRARATFPDCPEGTSAICYVQVPPKADAGPDRTLPEGSGAALFALLEEGCVGEWEIISGENGTLSDLHAPDAYFEGTDTEYKLKWTVTNACGSASDTVCIKYMHTVMNNNFLVVDTTDLVLSDSTLLLNGEYIIAFSEPVELNDSMLLVGVGDDSFLRKVVSYTYDDVNDVYDIMTTQGTIQDLLIEGVFSFDLISAFRSGKQVVISDRYPTRKDIAEMGWNGIYVMQPRGDANGARWSIDKDKPKLTWTPGNFKLPWDLAIVPTFEMEEPNFMCEMVKERFHVNSFKFGLYNTAYTASMQFFFPGKTSFTVKEKFPIIEPVDVGLSFYLGGVKITPQLSSDLTISATYSLGPEMSYTVLERGFVCNYIMYDEFEGWRFNSGRIDRHYDFDAQWPDYGDLTCKVSLGVKLSFLVYKCIGPYAGFSLSFEGTHNTFGDGFTAEQFKVSEQYELGVKAKVVCYDIMDFNWPFVTFDMLDYQNPYSMQIVTGNNQRYTPGQQLPTPLKVLVKNSRDKPAKGIRVKFETDGSARSVYTDNQGFASVYWTPSANATGAIETKAFSYNVKNEAIIGAPVIFKATPQPGSGPGGGGGGGWGGDDPDCSKLAVTAYVNGNGILLPKASGGTPPWMFSKDGTAYGTSVYYIPEQGKTYHFYVKDSKGCVSDCYYTHPTQDCSSSDLDLALNHQGSTVTAHASGGRRPYEFSLDGGSYGSDDVFYNLIDGEHTVNVRDANGCVDVASIRLEAYGGGSNGTGGGSVTVTTSPTVYVVDATSAHGGGSVSITGNATVTRYGLCWSRHHGPTTDDDYVQKSNNGNNSFSGYLMTNLEPNKLYYLRAFAVTNKGTVYGNEVGFSTTAVAPVVTSSGVGNITATTARALGNVSNTNGTTVTERGFCWSTGHNPTIHDDHVVCGFGTGAYSGDIMGLTPDTRYYLRAYAINSEGTGYSEEVRFDTQDGPPEISDLMITEIGSSYVICQYNVSSGSGFNIVKHGLLLSTMSNQNYNSIFGNRYILGSDSGDFEALLGRLVPNTRYYLKAYLYYGNTIVYTEPLTFDTGPEEQEWPDGLLPGVFSISSEKQVQFSQGNLQYQPNSNTWRFAVSQYDCVQGDNNYPNISSSFPGWIDLYGWGTSGYNHGAVCYQPWSNSQNGEDYYAYGESYYNLYDQTGQADWGYNAISNGGNQTNVWHTLSTQAMNYLMFERNTSSGLRYAKGIVGVYQGLILFPDDWDADLYTINEANTSGAFESNVISGSDWYDIFEPNGAVFLPAAGDRFRDKGNEDRDNYWGDYWLSSAYGSSAAAFTFSESTCFVAGWSRKHGFAVRLVKDVQPEAVLPQVETAPITTFTWYSSTCGGSVLSDGDAAVTERGVCWGTSHEPTIEGDHASAGTGLGDFLVLVSGLNPETTYYVRAYAINRAGVAYGDETSFTTLSSGGDILGYVDLGLPSGTLWATCNLGADSPEEYGDFFAWGETQPKETYDWSTYQYCNGSSNTLTKYCDNADYGYNGFVDNLSVLEIIDDAAAANLGDEWCIPSKEQWIELCQNTTEAWAYQNGVGGWSFTAPNGNSIFLPPGFNGGHIYGDWGVYCSNSLDLEEEFDPDPVWGFGFNEYGHFYYMSDRCSAQSVRPVRSNSSSSAPEGAINGLFTVSPGYQVYFSQGNLQYQPSSNSWRFATNQYDLIHTVDEMVHYDEELEAYYCDVANEYTSTYAGWIDMFGWGTSGYNHGAVCYQPWDISLNEDDYNVYGSETYNLYDQTGQADWGYNAISNGGNQQCQWRTLNGGEWLFLLDCRNTSSGVRFAKAKVGGADGVIVLPDNWQVSTFALNNVNQKDASFNSNVISTSDWMVLEGAGAVFLPASGVRFGAKLINRIVEGPMEESTMGEYWASSISPRFVDEHHPSNLSFYEDVLYPRDCFDRFFGCGVRLVHEGQGTALQGYSPWEFGPSGGSTGVENGITAESYTFLGRAYYGSCPILENGACWSTSPNPTLADNQIAGEEGTEYVRGTIHGLTPNTTYYLKMFVSDSLYTYFSEEIVFTTLPEGGDTHEYVDLGLPSGTLWATCNVGANAPEEYGDYFAWGETQPKEVYNWSTYQYCNGSNTTLTKYCNNPDYGYNGFSDTFTTLLPEDDAATVNWGDDWCIPTANQWEELWDYCTATSVIQNGVNGWQVTGPNGNTVFMPNAGMCWDSEVYGIGEGQVFWSSSLFTPHPWAASNYQISPYDFSPYYYGRCNGMSIRPVRSNSGTTGEVPEGAINGLFSVGEDTGPNGYSIRKVYFSQGNLQYQASTNTWKFAENQWDFVGEANNNISSTYDGWIDLFGWGTSGYDHGAVCYQPWSTSTNDSDYSVYGNPYYSLFDQTGQADWGYNSISNGGNMEHLWRTLTVSEWDYVLNLRNTPSGIRYAKAQVSGVKGIILLPDDWIVDIYYLDNPNTSDASFENNTLTSLQWATLEQAGAVFLSAAGLRYDGSLQNMGSQGYYWSASYSNESLADILNFGSYGLSPQPGYGYSHERHSGLSVRLVQDAPNGSGSGSGGGGRK